MAHAVACGESMVLSPGQERCFQALYAGVWPDLHAITTSDLAAGETLPANCLIICESEGISSIAEIRDGHTVAGALETGSLKQLFTARRETGATKNGERFVFSGKGERSISYSPNHARQFADGAVPVLQKVGFILREASSSIAALTMVLSRDVDVAVTPEISSAELAAVGLIMREAGGVVLPLFGSELRFGDAVVPAAIGIQKELTGGVRELTRRNMR